MNLIRLWEYCAQLTTRHSRHLVVALCVVTLFFTACLPWLETGTNVRHFHRRDALELIETIEDDFKEGSYLSLNFESQTDESLLSPKLLKRQLVILKEIEKNFDVTIDSLVVGIDEGLRDVKKRPLLTLKDDEYDPIGEAFLGMARPRVVRDLDKVSRHLLSHPDVVDFYEKFYISLRFSGMGGGAQFHFEIPYVKAIKSLVQLDPGYTIKEEKQILADIRTLTQKLETPDIKIYSNADNLISHDIDLQSRRNAALMGLILLLVDILLLWGIFRNRGEVVFALFIMVTSCLWTFGAASLVGVPISFLHLMVLPILLGTGIDDNLVFAKRLAEEFRAGKDLPAAIRSTYVATGNGIFLTTFTTFIAFLIAGLMSSSQAILSFYLLISFAMVVDFILTIFLQGAIRTELAKRGRLLGIQERAQAGRDAWGRFFNALPHLASRLVATRSGTIRVVCIVLSLAAIVVATSIQTEFDRRLFMRENMPTYTADYLEDEYFTRTDVGYVLIQGDVENQSLLQKMTELEKRMTGYPEIEKVLRSANVDSINDLFRKKRIRVHPKTDIHAAFEKVATSDATANYVIDETYRESAEHVLHKQGDRYDGLVMKFFVVGADPINTRKVCQNLEKDIQEIGFHEIPGIDVRVGGGEISFHLEEAFYFKDMIRSFGLTLIVIFFVLLVVWRKWQLAIMAIIPLLLSVALALGLMPLLGLKLNIVNLCLGAIIVGLGIDYPIHIIERYNEELDKSTGEERRTPLEASRIVLSTMGPQILAAALTTIVGFSAAMVMAMPVAESFGFLIGLTLFFVYLSSIFLLPVLLIQKDWKAILPSFVRRGWGR